MLLTGLHPSGGTTTGRPPSTFKKTYWGNPVAFIHDCIEWRENDGPTFYQDEIADTLYQKKREAVRGPHGLGKTALAAWLVLWFATTRDGEDWKIPTTASAWRQLSKFLWPEIHKWARRLRWDRIGREPFDLRLELQTLSLKLATGEAFAVASDTPELIEGAHADHLLYLFDEAKAIPDATFDAAEGAFSGAGANSAVEALAFAISTPGASLGRFYDIHARKPGFEDWATRHVTVEEAIKAGRITPEWVEQRRRQWGGESPVFQARVLGNFPQQLENALISLAWIEAARERELVPKGEPRLGVDIARFGDDDSCLIEFQEPCVMGGEVWHGHDTMKSAGRVKAKGLFANIDVIGVGAGVYDRLAEEGHPCAPINVAEKALDDEHFANVRAEQYWNVRLRFQSGAMDLTRLPRDVYDRLSGELTAIQYEYTSTGKIKIEEKAKLKERGGHSPDVADALMLAQIPPTLAETGVVANVEYSVFDG